MRISGRDRSRGGRLLGRLRSKLGRGGECVERPRLMTLPVSPYCEKARWGLERLGLDYAEERHLQGFHYPKTLRASGDVSLPVWIEGDAVVCGANAILRHLDQRLEPAARLYPFGDPAKRREVEELEALFDRELGAESRRWLVFHYQSQPAEAVLALVGQGVATRERLVAKRAMPLLRRLVAWRLDVSEEAVNQGLGKVGAMMHRTDGLLAAHGGPYLLGPKLTAADVALGCMMAPFVMPASGYGIELPDLDRLPRGMADTVRAFRMTATGRYVLELFEGGGRVREPGAPAQTARPAARA